MRRKTRGLSEEEPIVSKKQIYSQKRSAWFRSSGLRVNCDGTTLLDRKPKLRLKPNHYVHLTKDQIDAALETEKELNV